MKRVVFKSRWFRPSPPCRSSMLIIPVLLLAGRLGLQLGLHAGAGFGGAGERTLRRLGELHLRLFRQPILEFGPRQLIFAVSSTLLTLALALVLALAVDRQLKGSKLFRFFYIWPYALAVRPSARPSFSSCRPSAG